uniref:Peptidase A1 domain-containing protein n=1 Tax=Ananas comosus var. bracteatus TaxID=296719 RepID=A0A6V7NUB2_ANACO|nr:unnamed protein product [Ananas comosus var. bracteatus]
MDRLQGVLYLQYCILLMFLLRLAAAGGDSAMPATGFSLRLIHRDSAESPLRPRGNLTAEQLVRRLSRYTAARLLFLESTLHATPLDNDIRPTVLQDSWQFYAQLAIGTPPVRINLLIDTGSDLIWTRANRATLASTNANRSTTPAAPPAPSTPPAPTACARATCSAASATSASTTYTTPTRHIQQAASQGRHLCSRRGRPAG